MPDSQCSNQMSVLWSDCGKSWQNRVIITVQSVGYVWRQWLHLTDLITQVKIDLWLIGRFMVFNYDHRSPRKSGSENIYYKNLISTDIKTIRYHSINRKIKLWRRLNKVRLIPIIINELKINSFIKSTTVWLCYCHLNTHVNLSNNVTDITPLFERFFLWFMFVFPHGLSAFGQKDSQMRTETFYNIILWPEITEMAIFCCEIKLIFIWRIFALSKDESDNNEIYFNIFSFSKNRNSELNVWASRWKYSFCDIIILFSKQMVLCNSTNKSRILFHLFFTAK